MKNYLSEFLTACGYTVEDRAFLTETYALIASYPKPSELWNKALTLYEENVNCDLGACPSRGYAPRHSFLYGEAPDPSLSDQAPS